MFAIVGKGDGIGNLDGHRPYLYFDAGRVQSPHHFLVEVCDGARIKSYERRRLPGFSDGKIAGGEVELDFEGIAAIRDCGCGKPARGDVERHLPPMIYPRTQSQPYLAHNLHPHMERGAGGFPRR
jgi:hypothetical protein